MFRGSCYMNNYSGQKIDKNIKIIYRNKMSNTDISKFLKYDYSESNMKILFKNLTCSFDAIDKQKWDIFCKEFQTLKDDKKLLYDFEEFYYIKKRQSLLKVDLVCQIVTYMKKNMNFLYSENLFRTINCLYLKKYLYLFEKKVATFIVDMKKFSFYMTEKEKQKLENNIIFLQDFLQEIAIRKKKKYLSYYNIFYNGSAKQINIHGIKELIYQFI